jgi:PAS domain S-box-containing protein
VPVRVILIRHGLTKNTTGGYYRYNAADLYFFMKSTGNKTILIVEDEILIAMEEKKQLEGEGYRVILADSGEEAVDMICNKQENVDLILMDIDLGKGMDGTVAAQKILGYRDLPVLFLSSHIEKEVVEKTEEISSYGYVVKHSSFTVLDASVKMAFRLFDSRMREEEKHLALQESEERYRNIFNNSIEGIFQTTPEGRYNTVNASFARMFGYESPDEMMGIITDIGDQHFARREDLDKLIELINTTDGMARDFEVRMKCRDGSLIWILINARLIRTGGDGRDFFEGTCMDISRRKKAEFDLKEVNELYRLVTENMTEGVVVTDMDMKIRFITPSVIKRHGYSFEEFCALPLDRRMTAESYNRLMKMVSEVLIPERLADPADDILQVIDLEHYKKDGTTCWVESSFRIIRDSNGHPAGILGVGREITGRKWSENLLRTRMELMDFASVNPLDDVLVKMLDQAGELTSSPIGFYHFVDIDNKTITLQAWSTRTMKEFCRAEGKGMHYPVDSAGVWIDCIYTRGPVIHNDYSSLPHRKGMPEGHAAVVRELLVPVQRGGKIVAILGLGNKPVDYTPEDTRIVSYFADVAWEIAERKQAEAALYEETARRRILFEQSPDGILVIDPETAGFIEFNGAAHKQLGYTREEFAQLKIFDIEAKESMDETRNTIAQVISEGRADFETLQRRKDGEIRNILVTAQLVDVLGHRVYHCIWRDITEVKKAEEVIHRLLREKELILKEVHHRIKNNMNTIFSLLTIQAGDQTNPSTRDIILDAAGRVQSMMVLYNKLYRADTVTEVSLDEYLPDLINEIVRIHPNGETVDVITRIEKIPVSTKIVSSLGIVMNELVTNAMKYAFTGSRGIITVNAERKSERIVISFHDNGRGLPESVTFPNTSGFGLQLVSMVIKQIRGTIIIERAPGTKFIIEFSNISL